MFFHSDGPKMFPILLVIFGVALILNGLELLKINFSIIVGVLLLIWGVSAIWKFKS